MAPQHFNHGGDSSSNRGTHILLCATIKLTAGDYITFTNGVVELEHFIKV